MERRPHFGGRLLSVQLTVRVRGPVFILCSFSHNEVYVNYFAIAISEYYFLNHTC